MPELPDVEIFRQYAEKNALDQEIEKVTVDEPKIADVNESQINKQLQSQKLTKAERLGKYLLMPTTAESILIMHFGMTGWLEYGSGQKHQHTRASFTFSNGYALHFINPRKLGRIYLTNDLSSFKKKKKVGADALAVNLEEFQDLTGKKKGTLKSLLMNQSVIAGIGNIYSDEILFQAGMHPKTQTSDLEDYQKISLFQFMKEVLHKTIEHNADPDNFPAYFIIPRRKEGEQCPSCGGKIKKDQVSGRNFYYCPNCQK